MSEVGVPIIESTEELLNTTQENEAPYGTTMPIASESKVPGINEFSPILAQIENLFKEGTDRILRVIDERQALDRFREMQIDRLHAELQQYKTDFIGKAVRPVLQSLISLHNNMSKVLEALDAEDQEQLQPIRMVNLLKGFREDVETELNRNGVTMFNTENERFDAKRQRMIRKVETTCPTEVGQIAAQVRPGFEQAEHILEK